MNNKKIMFPFDGPGVGETIYLDPADVIAVITMSHYGAVCLRGAPSDIHISLKAAIELLTFFNVPSGEAKNDITA